MTREEALEILGLEPHASLDEAKKAYRTLVKYYHPDRNAASNASVMFRIIQEAWEVILNDTGPKHAEAETAYAEELIRKEEELENWIRGLSIGAWLIFWILFSRIKNLPEDSIWFWAAISTTGIIFAGIVVGMRRWYKKVENGIRVSAFVVWLIFWDFFSKIIDLPKEPEDSIWIQITIYATGLIFGEIVIKIRRWLKEKETADIHQER